MVWRASERDWKQCSILGSTLCRAAIWSTQCWNILKNRAECWSFVLGFKRRAETLKDDREVRFNLGHYAGLTFQSPKEERHLFSEPSTAANTINGCLRLQRHEDFRKNSMASGLIDTEETWQLGTHIHLTAAMHQLALVRKSCESVLDREKG